MTHNNEAPSRKLARPRKNRNDPKRATLTFRVRESIYEKLRLTAEARKSSLSEEIENVIERYYELSSDMATSLLLNIVRDNIYQVEMISGKKWNDNAQVASACGSTISATITTLANLFIPTDDIPSVEQTYSDEWIFGRAVALRTFMRSHGDHKAVDDLSAVVDDWHERWKKTADDKDAEKRKEQYRKTLAEALLKYVPVEKRSSPSAMPEFADQLRTERSTEAPSQIPKPISAKPLRRKTKAKA